MSEKVFPTVSCDVQLGSQFSEVYCNPRYITAKALELGMTTEQIANLQVYFSADIQADVLADTHTLGHYDHDDTKITILLGHWAAQHCEITSKLDEKELPAKEKKRIKRYLAAEDQIKVNEILLHEVRHAADFALMPEEAARQERSGHFNQTYGKRERYQKLFGRLSVAGMCGIMTGMLDMLNSLGVENTTRPLAIIMGSSVVSIVGSSQTVKHAKKNRNPKQLHLDYLDRPWEVRAREYSEQNAQAATSAQPPLVRYKVR